MTTSKADEKPKAFQEACAEDSKPKFDRQGKNCVAMPTGNFGEDDRERTAEDLEEAFCKSMQNAEKFQ